MLHFGFKSSLYDQAADGGGAGGGAGAAASPGLTKDDVTAILTNMINGMDKRYNKQFKDFETSLSSVKDIAKVFGGVKPKKLAKLLAKAGKKNKDGDGADDANTGGNKDGDGADANRNKQQQGQGKVLEDPFKKKKFRELMEKVTKLETERDDANKKADSSLIDSKVNDVLGEFVWANPKARGSAFKELRPMVERDSDGDLVVGDAKFDSFIRAKVPEEYDYLLAPKLKSGSGAVKGAKGSKQFDTDSIGPQSTKDEIAEMAREIAQAYGSGGQ